jgi:hypothetical protein
VNRQIVIIALLLGSQAAFAESFVFELPYEVEPKSAAAYVLSADKFQKLSVDMRKTPTSLKINVDVPESRAEDLVNAVVVYQNGSISSIPLHVPSKGELSSESQRAVEQRIKSLQASVDKGELEVQQLTKDMNAASFNLRERAGLKEVNAVYKRIEEVDAEIAKLKAEQTSY